MGTGHSQHQSSVTSEHTSTTTGSHISPQSGGPLFVAANAIDIQSNSGGSTPFLDSIDAKRNEFTIGMMIKQRAHQPLPTNVVNLNRPLFGRKVDENRMKLAFEYYITRGARDGRWQEAYKMYNPDIIYVPNDGHLLVGKGPVTEGLTAQIAMLPYGKYNRVAYYQMDPDSGFITFQIANDLIPHGCTIDEAYTIPNMSMLFYSEDYIDPETGLGTFFFAYDWYDTLEFLHIIAKYLLHDTGNGGDAAARFVAAGGKMLFNNLIEGSMSNITNIFKHKPAISECITLLSSL